MNPNVHNAFRIQVKKYLYIKCMKVYPELFKGKREILENKKQNSNQILEIESSNKIQKYRPYLWNCSLE